jgi:hypothetical protein
VQVARGRYGFRKSDIEKLSRDGWQPLDHAAARASSTGLQNNGRGQ